MNNEQIKNEIEQLVDQLNYHSHKYYVEDSPVISDYEYDMKLRRLKQLEEDFPEFKLEYSPTQRVGGEALNTFDTVVHEVPLKSLQDVFSYSELEEFDNRVKKIDNNAEYVVELKIDGLSVSLEYKNGILVRGSTRGNGIEGEDVTANIKTVGGVPLKLNENIDITVRGEVYMPHKSFELVNKERDRLGEQLFANPRNAAAGSLRQLESSVTAKRKLDIFVFNIQKCDSHKFETHSESLAYLSKLGFKVSPYYNSFSTVSSVFAEIEKFDNIRKDLDFDIDGAVIKVDSLALRDEIGETTKFPKWAVAYKYPPEQKPTVLRDIIISVGRTGVLTPNAVFDTVKLAGTSVSRATLHNRCFINDLDIRIGDTVIVQKAGEIIPEIVRVDKTKRTGSEKEYSMPSKCPECGTEVVADESGIMVRCPNPLCEAKTFRKIVHFVSKEAMDIDGLGPSVVDQLIRSGLIADVADLYKLKENDLIGLEGFADVSALKLIASIENSKNAGLDRLINALGIKNIGQKASKTLAKHFGNIDSLISASIEEIVSIDDFGDISAKSVIDFFNIQSNIDLIDKLKSLEVKMTYEKNFSDDRFVGKIFVLSGGLDSLSRNEASEIIERLGGKTSSSVSSKTSYLLLGDKPGSKADKANKLGVPIIDEQQFLQMIK